MDYSAPPNKKDDDTPKLETKRPAQNPDAPPIKDPTPAQPVADPLPPRTPLEKPTRDDDVPANKTANTTAPEPPKKKKLKLPKSNLPNSYFDYNGHARPWSMMDPSNSTDSTNNDQYHYKN